MKFHSRRSFLKTTLGAAAGLSFLPAFFPSRVFGADAPSRKIQVAQIGCGRMGCADMFATLREPLARIVAVCDVDSKRLAGGKKKAEDYYREQGEAGAVVNAFGDYRKILASPEIDAVIISTPDHWHALVAVEAALAGKHIYLQKPVTYTIAEAIALRKVVEARKIILQTGSQQRSERPWGSFRKASEAVRNGRIGRVRTIRIGLGLDKALGKIPKPTPAPSNLDYERWLGPGPEQPYIEARVHPQNNVDGRPGWATTEGFGLGLIANWGAHHLDIAQWALAQELGGPDTIEARAKFLKDDLMTTHNTYHIEMLYPGKVRVILDDAFTNGIRFEGDDGWVFCSRSGDPDGTGDARKPLYASNPNILAPLDGNAIRWQSSKSHYGNWLESIIANRPPVAPIQHSVRTLETCAIAWIAMKRKRKLTWDVATESFVNDTAANALKSRPARKAEFDFEPLLKKAGIAL